MLIELKIEISLGEIESINEVLLEQGWDRWSILENNVNRQAWLIGIFATESEARGAFEVLAELCPVLKARQAEQRKLENADWRDSYKAHFHAWKFGRLHWVPVWERAKFELPPGDAVLWLDPGLAFGTGNHETTRLCVERLVGLAELQAGKKTTLIDAGCGSGILALSGVLLGYVDIVGFDLDPEAIRVSEENAALNTLGGRVQFFLAGLDDGLRRRTADVVVANIQADILQQNAAILLQAVEPGGVLILSGILAVEIETVRAKFAALAPTAEIGSRTMGEWSDLQISRGGAGPPRPPGS